MSLKSLRYEVGTFGDRAEAFTFPKYSPTVRSHQQSGRRSESIVGGTEGHDIDPGAVLEEERDSGSGGSCNLDKSAVFALLVHCPACNLLGRIRHRVFYFLQSKTANRSRSGGSPECKSQVRTSTHT